MAVMSGIIMIGTSSYIRMVDFVGAGIIFVGLLFVVKKEYLEVEF
jgi:hypothetical protein